MTQTEALIKKLYLAKHKRIARYNQDEHSSELDALLTVSEPVSFDQTYDVIFAHAYSLEEMKNLLQTFAENQTIAKNGLCYIVYPKLNNPHYPGIHRDAIFPALEVDDALGYLPGTSYKFNRMVGLNETFTLIGIKNQVENTAKAKSSGRVADYEHHIPEIIANLQASDQPERAVQFQALTPGRQRNYARHIYSARTEPTREKRIRQLMTELSNPN